MSNWDNPNDEPAPVNNETEMADIILESKTTEGITLDNQGDAFQLIFDMGSKPPVKRVFNNGDLELAAHLIRRYHERDYEDESEQTPD